MYFNKKNYLKTNHNHIIKQTLIKNKTKRYYFVTYFQKKV